MRPTILCPSGPPNPPEVETLFPQGSSPDSRVECLSALCSYGLTPLVVTGGFRHVLTHHFSDPRNILNATIRQRITREGVWRDDDQTGIVIDSLSRWRPELSAKKLTLLLKEGEWQWQQVGIGNRAQVDVRTGRQTYGGYWAGSHTIFALATEGAEALALATEVMKCFLMFLDEISSTLELQKLTPVSIGAISALKESRETYVVPVTLAYIVPDFWYTQPEAPRTKRITFQSSAILAGY